MSKEDWEKYRREQDEQNSKAAKEQISEKLEQSAKGKGITNKEQIERVNESYSKADKISQGY